MITQRTGSSLLTHKSVGRTDDSGTWPCNLLEAPQTIAGRPLCSRAALLLPSRCTCAWSATLECFETAACSSAGNLSHSASEKSNQGPPAPKTLVPSGSGHNFSPGPYKRSSAPATSESWGRGPGVSLSYHPKYIVRSAPSIERCRTCRAHNGTRTAGAPRSCRIGPGRRRASRWSGWCKGCGLSCSTRNWIWV